MTVDSPPPAPPAPEPSPATGNGRSGYLWARDLVETTPSQLRKRRLRRMVIAACGAVVVAGLVAVVAVSLHDSRPDVVVTDSFKPHDKVLSSYLIPAPAGALAPPSGPAARELDEATAAEVTGDWTHLRRYKYVRGHERTWQQETGELVTVRLMRFRGAENAARYLRDLLDLSAQGKEVKENAVAGIPGGRSIITTAPVGDSDSTYVTVSGAAAGDVAVFAIVTGNEQVATAELTEGLLTSQYAQL